MNWVANAIKRIIGHEQENFCCLTNLQPGPVSIRFERMVQMLRRPRFTVTCPTGTDVADIMAKFRELGWGDAAYSVWFEKNGFDLVQKGYLHE